MSSQQSPHNLPEKSSNKNAEMHVHASGAWLETCKLARSSCGRSSRAGPLAKETDHPAAPLPGRRELLGDHRPAAGSPGAFHRRRDARVPPRVHREGRSAYHIREPLIVFYGDWPGTVAAGVVAHRDKLIQLVGLDTLYT
jgi:hypothetical protein